jgi:hypothetical protein
MIYNKIYKLSGIFEKLAFNVIKAVLNKVKLPLLAIKEGGFILIIPLAEENNLLVPKGQITLDEPNLPFNPGFNKNEWKRIASIIATDPWIAVYLLGAALYLGKKVVGDSVISKEAQAVMKRLYIKNKGTGLIIDNVIQETPEFKDQPWMTAGYLNSGEHDSAMSRAFAAGEEIKNNISKEDLETLINIVERQWNTWKQLS